MEKKTLDSIYEFIRSEFVIGPTNIIEIGAHVGTDTELLAEVVRDGRMLAFEPDPRNIQQLITRTKKYPYVEIIEKAVGSTNGKATFNLSSGTPPGGGGPHTASSSLLKPKNHLSKFSWVTFDQTVEVDVVALDSCWNDDVVDLVWADVQGAEMDMIRGGAKTLAQTRFLFTEFNDGEMYEGQRGLSDLMAALPGDWGIVQILGDEVLLQNKAFGANHIPPPPPLSIVMQGPVLPYTMAAVDSARRWFPSAELLLSTWDGENVDGLNVDETVRINDPGPGLDEACKLTRGNLVRMAIGCQNGIKYAANRLIMKVRTDTIFIGNECMRHVGMWPKRSSVMPQVFANRIIVPNIGTADPDVHVCFQVSDWVMLGLKEDIGFLFDVDIGDKQLRNPITSPEQYLWFNAVKKKIPDFGLTLDHIDHKTPELIEATQNFMSNNLVILDTRAQFNFYCGKYKHLPDDQSVNMRHAKWASWYGRML